MCLAEMAPRLVGWQVDIVATDISSAALEKPAAGTYSSFEVQRGLPIRHLVKYFVQQDDGWRISPDIRAMVQFRPFNLLDDFAVLGRFDVVFCRNVLGGFDQATRRDVLRRIAGLMPPDGTLNSRAPASRRRASPMDRDRCSSGVFGCRTPPQMRRGRGSRWSGAVTTPKCVAQPR